MRMKTYDEMEINENIISFNKSVIKNSVPALLGKRLKQVVLFGSCARGDYHADSDMDVAVIIDDDRESMNSYVRKLIDVSTDIAMENYSVVNFLCIPSKDFEGMQNYKLYKNIKSEGIRIYG